ncbi:sialate O-acetylesterase [Clostridium sp.]|uniref:sialate O-acetylesterase n=1 Tax=Clostridium sp. TaxID=1506 RepID=UPI002FC6D4C8
MNKPCIDVFFLIGQSNALGMGDIKDAPMPNSKCFEYVEIDEIIPMRKFLDVSRGNGTIAQNFALRWTELTGRSVCFIQSAVDGSMIKNWGHDRYNYLDNAIKKFERGINTISKIYSINTKYTIWIQGESDCKYGTDPLYYRERLKKLVNDLRKIDSLKVFLSLTGYWDGVSDKRVNNILATQCIVADEVENLIVASKKAVTFRERGLLIDDVHYSQEALNELGLDIANNIYKYENEGKLNIEDTVDLNKNREYIREIIKLYDGI